MWDTARRARDMMRCSLSDGSILHLTDIIVLDEFLCGSMYTIDILSLWMEARRKGLKVPKLLQLGPIPFDSNVTVSTLKIGFRDPSQMIKSARSSMLKKKTIHVTYIVLLLSKNLLV